jgi:tetratricopeptide (TPR) repeat protein
MRRATCPAAVCLLMRLALPGSAAAAPDARDSLARARVLYNQRQFEAAINAAEQARLIPARADSADLVAARAYLERFRESAASDDLTNARERLRRLDPNHFSPGERAEFIVGLGEALFFDESYGAAADVFGSALAVTPEAAPDSRERTLDWWATSLDRDARPRPELDRQNVYQRIRDRMASELLERPASAAAAYWLAAAARAQGDLQAAWDAAEAAWVRAPLGPDRGDALRADLDRLVQEGIVPERARVLALSPETVRADWERFKERWKH